MATVTQVVSSVVTKTMASATASSTNRAAPQGGILEGENPSVYDPKNPIIIFIIQASIIIIFCRMLHWPLSKLRQPRVIAEVIGGVLLGPSVMGRIPGFTTTIFPTAAMPNLTLVANLGLVLFLFLVGLEVDLRFLTKNWRVAVSVGFLGMALPFGLGCAIAYGLYHEFHTEPGTVPISFGTYALFIGVAMAITAFPVLCRILTELKLLSTPVGIIVLAAGVGNDVVGWILLALCVALVNAGSGLTALWILLTALGYILFLVYAVRPLFLRLLRKTRSLEDGPSQSIVALTLLIALASAFFTGAIGIHPIFGAFIAGLICPHEGGFAIKVTEKVEDLVSTVFLPLYFALSGLSTNLGLLNTGITWAYVIGVISIAFCAKFAGGMFAARLCGMVWRESATIGALMSCKGLVELIVLNIGLQAKILSTRTFTIFVVMALVTTFATTPLTSALYPPWYQKKIEQWKKGEIDWDTGRPTSSVDDSLSDIMAQKEGTKVKSVLVYLRLDNMPSLVAFVSLFRGVTTTAQKMHPNQDNSNSTEAISHDSYKSPVEVHGLRLVELTERTSSVMKVSEIDEYVVHDPLINTFRTLGRLCNLAVSGDVAVGPENAFADILTSKASEEGSDLLVMPWSESGAMSELRIISNENVKDRFGNSSYADFASRALDAATCNTVVFIDQGFGGTKRRQRPQGLQRAASSMSMRSQREHHVTTPARDRGHHIFMPFFGGADSHVALRLVMQLVENEDITATIIHFDNIAMQEESLEPLHTQASSPTTAKHVVAVSSPEVYASRREKDAAFFAAMQRSIPPAIADRIVLEAVQTTQPLSEALARAESEIGQNPKNAGDLIIVGRNKGLFGDNEKMGSCLGTAASKFIDAGLKGSILVVQARPGLD